MNRLLMSHDWSVCRLIPNPYVMRSNLTFSFGFYHPPGQSRQRVVVMPGTGRRRACFFLHSNLMVIHIVGNRNGAIDAESPICIPSNFVCGGCVDWWMQSGASRVCGWASDGANHKLLVPSVEHHPQMPVTAIPANAVCSVLETQTAGRISFFVWWLSL